MSQSHLILPLKPFKLRPRCSLFRLGRSIPVQTSAAVPSQVLPQLGQTDSHSQNQLQFITQSAAPPAQAINEANASPPVALIPGQSQQIPSQFAYSGFGTTTQSQVNATTLVQTQPPLLQGTANVQPSATIAPVNGQLQLETPVKQSIQMPGLMQGQLQPPQSQPRQLAQPAAGLTLQYHSQPPTQNAPSLQPDTAHMIQQQQPVLQFQQMIVSPGAAGNVGAQTAAVDRSVSVPN